MNRVVGIDPGAKGGISLLEWDDGDARPQLVKALPMPLLARDGGRVDASALAATLDAFRPHLVVLERVGSAPGQGVSSAFAFGRGYGAVEAVVQLAERDTVLVTPQEWKAAYRLPGGAAGKRESIEMAARLVDQVLPEGQAEAVLIAWSQRRKVVV